MTLKEKKTLKNEILPLLEKVDKALLMLEYPQDNSTGITGVGAKEFQEGLNYLAHSCRIFKKLVGDKK